MVGDNIMPPPTKIYASTIGVTIVGPKNVPERTMPGFLCVHRQRIGDALTWLKANKPFYANINISEDRLGQVEEDGIPLEIMGTICHLDDVEKVECERAGYVPDNNNFRVGADDDGLAVGPEYGKDADS